MPCSCSLKLQLFCTWNHHLLMTAIMVPSECHCSCCPQLKTIWKMLGTALIGMDEMRLHGRQPKQASLRAWRDEAAPDRRDHICPLRPQSWHTTGLGCLPGQGQTSARLDGRRKSQGQCAHSQPSISRWSAKHHLLYGRAIVRRKTSFDSEPDTSIAWVELTDRHAGGQC